MKREQAKGLAGGLTLEMRLFSYLFIIISKGGGQERKGNEAWDIEALFSGTEKGTLVSIIYLSIHSRYLLSSYYVPDMM